MSSRKHFTASFQVDTGATESLALAEGLRIGGSKPVGKTVYELADGRIAEYELPAIVIGQVTLRGRGWTQVYGRSRR